jgi:hypothetical protein
MKVPAKKIVFGDIFIFQIFLLSSAGMPGCISALYMELRNFNPQHSIEILLVPRIIAP